MNFQHFQNEVDHFKKRIIEAFPLKVDHNNIIQHKRIVINWLRKKQLEMQSNKKAKQNEGIIKSILNLSQKQQKKKKLQKQMELYTRLKNCMKNKSSQEIKSFQEFCSEQLFKQIKQSLKILIFNQHTQYYGFVKAPLIGEMYIEKKQDFKKCVENSPKNNLKFIATQDKVAHKYQRNLVQQVFGRVIRRKGALSLMIKIDVNVGPDQKNIQLYIYIEDLRPQQLQHQQLSKVYLKQISENQYSFQIKNQEKTIQINKQSFLQIFLSEMMVIPVQTLVSDFVIEINESGADIIKYHQGSRQQIDSSTLLKDHPSIRNPLFYFYNYIRKNQIKSIDILKWDTKRLYANFYCSLKWISKLIINDFNINLDDKRVNSLCFNNQTFYNLWQVIHELVMISDWVEQVINPLKKTVTIFQILNKFCPLLTQMVSFQEMDFEQYRYHLLNLEADTFITSYVSKSVLERYKDVYVSLNSYQDNNSYQTIYQVYQKIFAPIMDEFDLSNCDSYQAIYFLNFVAEHKCLKKQNFINSIHKSWRSVKIWKNIFHLKQIQQLPYIGFYLNMFGFYLGIDTVQLSSVPFQSVKNQSESTQFMKDLQYFIAWMKKNQLKKIYYLSILFKKAYRYRKFQICSLLLDHNILINDFEEIFEVRETLTQNQKLKKDELSHKMQKKSPQMHRNLKWQELLRKTLKEETEFSVPIRTLKYGNIYVSKYIFQMQLNEIENNISRKDYMFDPERNITKVKVTQSTQAYVELTSYPLVRQFYKIFLQKLSKGHLMPNFSALLSEGNVMLHLIESIHAGLNFEKGHNSLSQSDLKNLLDKDELSESIIISTILMPNKVQLKNIITLPSDDPKHSIFMIDFRNFYCSNPIQKTEGNYSLKTLNCLFTFDEMYKTISLDLMKKYSNIQILSFIKSLFLQLSNLIKTINSMEGQIQQNHNKTQLLGLIFQNDFIINLTQRMFKIQNCFKDCLQKNKSISHMEILNKINPQLSYYYSEIIKSSASLIQRQKNLHDEMWRKPFVNHCNLIQFFSSSSIVPEPLNVFPNHYRKFCFDGPTQALNSLYSQSKKFVIYENNVQKLNCLHHQTLQYHVRNLEFSKLSGAQRKQTVIKLQQQSKAYLSKKGHLPLNIIKLQQIDILKASELDFAYQRLKQVILQNIKTNDIQLSSMLKLMESVICLKMKNLTNLFSLGQSSYLNFSLQMRNLRILHIIECPDLKSIDIKCQVLENVTLRDNPHLQTLFISSPSLKNLDCSGSNKIKLQNVGLYVLRGLNVLLSDIACDGYLKKLRDDSYSTYVLNILKFLLNRLKQSEIKAIIILTLTKLRVLDQEVAATLIGVSSISKLSNLLLKYSVQLEKKVYFKLIQLFFDNQNVESFAVTEMNLTNIQQISIYLKQIKKMFKHSFKQTKINQTIKNNFESFKNIFTTIQLNKHYKLQLDGLEQDNYEQAIQIIDLLINKRADLEKVDLVINRCKISTNLFQVIFNKKKVVTLQINNSIINNGIWSADPLESLKSLKIINTTINNFQLLKKLDNLAEFKLNNCQLPRQLNNFYKSLGHKKLLKTFKFTNQKPINKNLQLKLLLQSLKQFPNLQTLNLSNNCFNQNQLQQLDEFMKTSSINQLILRNFYQKDVKYSNFKVFLQKCRLKSLQIEFPLYQMQNLKCFIQSLSQQQSLLKLYLKTQIQIQSTQFCPLNNNKILNTINSNQLIPTWLKKHVKKNIQQRSKIANRPNYSGNIDFSMGSKVQDYHKLGLSMDGGGVRGLLLAAQLKYLADQVGYPLHKIFDVIGGTSIGGILALSVTSTLDNIHPIMSPQQLKQVFTIHGKQIFKKSQIRSLASLIDTKYNPLYLQNLMNSYFKDTRLSDTLKTTNAIVTAVSRLNNKDVIFKSTDAILNRDKDFYVKDIARATSAAPTYFPSAEIKNVIASEKLSLVDGGMGMNNPSKLVIDEVKKMAFNSHQQNNYFLLSLGTGRLPSQNIPQYAGIKDLAPIIDSFTESAGYFIQRDLNENYKGRFMRVSPLINITKKQGQLDSTEPHILKTYQETGLTAAKDFFTNTIIFGKYRTMNLVEWLRQNTQKKYEI